MAKSQSENTSGQGSLAVIPQEIRGWNWGAFLLTWIWGARFNVWIAFLIFIPFFDIIWVFVLGAKGNEWAWQKNKWDSIEHFKRTQRNWDLGGLVGLVVFLVVFFVLSLIGMLS